MNSISIAGRRFSESIMRASEICPGFIAAWVPSGAYAGGNPDADILLCLPVDFTDNRPEQLFGVGYRNPQCRTHSLQHYYFVHAHRHYAQLGFSGADDLDDPIVHLNIWHHYGTITLSTTNTSAQVYTDIKSLLANWPLNDDALYPWRTDTKVSVAPLVTRLELQNAAPLGFNPYTVDDAAEPD